MKWIETLCHAFGMKLGHDSTMTDKHKLLTGEQLILKRISEMAIDLSKLKASIDKLSADLHTFLGSLPDESAVQGQVDALQASVDAADATIQPAAPPSTPPTT